jgi:glucose-1-phosphate thymidylyltransferase
MIGVIPAAGCGTRIQPLGCSKELLPVGSRRRNGRPHPKAVAEYLIERMLLAGADRVCMVISPEKTDIVRYFADSPFSDRIFYAIQPRAKGLCDAVFRAVPHLNPWELVLIGLPDTIWFPSDAYAKVPADSVHLITFPVPDPEHFDAVIVDQPGQVAEVQVKRAGAANRRVWGAITMPAHDMRGLFRLWQERQCRDEYLGHLFNAWIERGNRVTCDEIGESYLDVGTLEGYRRALAELHQAEEALQEAAA